MSRFIPLSALQVALEARAAGRSESSAMVSVSVAEDCRIHDDEVQEAVRLAYAF